MCISIATTIRARGRGKKPGRSSWWRSRKSRGRSRVEGGRNETGDCGSRFGAAGLGGDFAAAEWQHSSGYRSRGGERISAGGRRQDRGGGAEDRGSQGRAGSGPEGDGGVSGDDRLGYGDRA